MKDEAIRMPRIDINDDFVMVGQWLVENGEYVMENQPVAVLETSKKTVEIPAESEGYLCIKVQEGEEREVGAEIAYISEKKTPAAESLKASRKDERKTRRFTKKAEKLLKEYPGLDITKLPEHGIIREQDILELIPKPYQIEETLTNHVLIYGRGGFCKYAVDIINQTRAYQLDGIIEFHYPENTEIYGIPVIGNDDELESFYKNGYRKIFNAVGFREQSSYRKPPYEKLKKIGYEMINLVDCGARISSTVKMGEGNLICTGACIGSDSILGNNIIVNVNAAISHDCIISDHCHIASGAVLAGGVTIGENSLIGQGVSVYMGTKIGRNVVIYNGCSIMKDIPDGTVVRE